METYDLIIYSEDGMSIEDPAFGDVYPDEATGRTKAQEAALAHPAPEVVILCRLVDNERTKVLVLGRPE